jgi:hypothetical protein
MVSKSISNIRGYGSSECMSASFNNCTITIDHTYESGDSDFYLTLKDEDVFELSIHLEKEEFIKLAKIVKNRLELELVITNYSCVYENEDFEIDDEDCDHIEDRYKIYLDMSNGWLIIKYKREINDCTEGDGATYEFYLGTELLKLDKILQEFLFLL